MARNRNQPGYEMGQDASYRKPSFVPDDRLRSRDDSGGIGFERHAGEFGDGGFVFGGDKPYLTASKMNGDDGMDDSQVNDDISETEENPKAGRSSAKDAGRKMKG